MKSIVKRRYLTSILSIVLFVFLVGCTTKPDESALESSNNLTESNQGTENASSDTSTEDNTQGGNDGNQSAAEDAKEVTPVPRKMTASGGLKVLTPEGIIFSDIQMQTIGDMSVVRIDLPGIEYRKSYELELFGDLTNKGEIVIYLLDGEQIDGFDAQNNENDWVLDLMGASTETVVLAKSVYALSDNNEGVLLTNSVKTVKKGHLVITLPQNISDLKTIESVQIRRKVGDLMFSDEFDKEGLLDDQFWTYEVGGNGWGNGELQFYTDQRLENAQVKDGHLVITALEETRNNNDYTSARVRTKEGFLYGRYEIRGILPYGRGTWPAIWMMPLGNAYGGWPHSGEIDIMEHVGYDMDHVHANLHTGALNFRKGNNPTGSLIVPKVDTEPHTFVLEWSKYQVDFYIDDVLSMTHKNGGEGPSYWPFNQPFYLIMNIAVGGAWGGQQGIDPIFPQSMKIDYVRFFELNDPVIDQNPPEKVKKIDAEIQGNMVKLVWPSAKDDYLVDYYEVHIKSTNENQWVKMEFEDTLGHFTNLKASTTYQGEITAVDDGGNVSEPLSFSFETQSIIVNTIDEWTSIDQRLFNTGGKISSDQTYIGDFEAKHQVGYIFDVKKQGQYQLEIEVSGRLFDGLITLLDDEGIQLAEVIAKKTGADDTFNVVVTEPFALDKGLQTLVLEVTKNGFNIKNIRCVEVK
jgi:beta-glucanase (GH16 family)